MSAKKRARLLDIRSLDLDGLRNIDPAAYKADIAYLLALPASINSNAAGRHSSALSISIDCAACNEEDGELTALYVSMSHFGDPDTTVSMVAEALPVFGLELIDSWSEGIWDQRFDITGPLHESFHARRADGRISNHQALSIRQQAIEKIAQSFPDTLQKPQ
jgi:hypothetical protein